MTTDNEKKLFEEYRMELIYLDGEIVISDSPERTSPEAGGDDHSELDDPQGDEGWGFDEPGI